MADGSADREDSDRKQALVTVKLLDFPLFLPRPKIRGIITTRDTIEMEER